MPRYIALLRGINVGGHRVKMDVLRRSFEALEFQNVETFIASGNVIFETKSRNAAVLEKQIARHLEHGLGFAVPTMIRTTREVEAIAAFPAFNPSGTENPDFSINVIFLSAAPAKKTIEEFAALESKADAFRFEGREIHWLCRGKISKDSLAAPKLAKSRPDRPTTVRNIKTIRALAEKYGAQ